MLKNKKVNILFVILLEALISYCQVLDTFLFNQYPLVSIKVEDYCEKGLFFSNLQPIINKDYNLFIGWSQQCGAYLYQIQDPFLITSKKLIENTKDVQKIYQQQNSQNLIVIESQKIIIYSISNDLAQFSVIKEIKLDSSINKCIDVVEQVDKQAIIIVYETQLLFIYSNTLNLLSTKIQIKPSESAITSFIMINNKYMLIGQNYDLNLHEYLEFEMKTDAISTIKLCTIFSQFQEKPIKLINMNKDYFAILTSTSSLIFSNFSKFLTSALCSDISFQLQNQDNSPLDNKNCLVRYLQMYQNEQYLIQEEEFNHIKITQLNYSTTIQSFIYQLIPVTENTYSLIVTSDNQYLISLTQNSINFYQRVKANYQNKTPSIVSINDNILFNQFTQQSKISWRCAIEQDLFFYSKASDGVIVLRKDPINQTLNKENTFLFQAGTYDLAIPLKGTTNLIVGSGQLYFVNYSNVQSPVVSFSSTFGFPNIDADYAQASQDQKTLFVAGGKVGLLIINITDFKNPVILSSIYYQNDKSSTSENLQTYDNDKYVFVAYRYIGIVVYDVRSLSSPQFLSIYPMSVGEDLRISQNGKFMVVSNYEQGISIIDITDLKNMFEISKLEIKGSTLRAYLFYNDQYILSTSQIGGQLQLIDIRDLKTPKIIQEYQYNLKDKAFDVCISNDKGYLAMGDGIVQFNLFSDKYMNLYIIDMQAQNFQKNINQDTVFKVGQYIGIQLAQIFPSPERKFLINNAYYYNQFQIQQLPEWAQFNIIQQTLFIKIKKESMTKQQNNSIETKYFLFEVKEKIFDSDFVYTQIGITLVMSQDIFSKCLMKEIINSTFYVIKFSQNIINSLFSSLYNQKQINHILYILQQKSITFPFTLSFQNSISFDVNQNKIISLSNYISLTIQSDTSSNQINSSNINNISNQSNNISQSKGSFMKVDYPGVLVSYSQMLDSIRIEGSLDNVNKVLQNKLRYVNFTDSEIKLLLTIQDNLNYELIQEISSSNIKFIQLNQQMKISKFNNIQKDFEQKFDGSSISLLSAFSYTFNSNVFDAEEGFQLNYKAFLKKGNVYEEIPQDYWLQFESNERRFFGNTGINQYKQNIILLINATDGYSYATDTLEINIDIIPAAYIIQMVLQILFPIFCIAVVWKYKHNFVNYLREESNKKSPIELDIGKEYFIQIPILENSLRDGIKIWKQYKNTVVKDIVIRELVYLRMEYQNRNRKVSLAQEKSQFFLNSPLSQNNSNSNLSQNKISLNESSNFKDIRKIGRHISRKIDSNQGSVMQKRIQSKITQAALKANVYFNSDGRINKKAVLESIYVWCQKFIKNQKIEEEIKNPNSKLSSVLIGLAARYFSQIDETTHKVLEFLKKAAIEDGFIDNDWYKAYVQICPDPEKVVYQSLPPLYFNDAKIDEKLNWLVTMQPNIKQSEFLLPLIKENLKAFTFGFTTDTRGVFPRNRGECIDALIHQVKCIKSFRPIKAKTCCKKNKVKLINMEKELSLNCLLPSWVQSVDIINGSIFLVIKAHSKDQGKYQLRIISTQSIILKEISIHIGTDVLFCNQSNVDANNKSYQNIYNIQESKSQFQDSRLILPDSRSQMRLSTRAMIQDSILQMAEQKQYMNESKLQLPDIRLQIPKLKFSAQDQKFSPDSKFLPQSPFNATESAVIKIDSPFKSSDIKMSQHFKFTQQSPLPESNHKRLFHSQLKQDDVASQDSSSSPVTEDDKDDDIDQDEAQMHQSPRLSAFKNSGQVLQDQTKRIQESMNKDQQNQNENNQ